MQKDASKLIEQVAAGADPARVARRSRPLREDIVGDLGKDIKAFKKSVLECGSTFNDLQVSLDEVADEYDDGPTDFNEALTLVGNLEDKLEDVDDLAAKLESWFDRNRSKMK